MKRFLTCTILALASASAAYALEIKPKIDFEFGGEYSDLKAQDTLKVSPNWIGKLLFVPVMKLGENDLLAPAFFSDYTHRERVMEEEGVLMVDRLTVMAKPAWKHKFDGFSATLAGVAKRVTNKERDEQAWSTARYDYEEYGASLKAAIQALDLEAELGWGSRTYPNHHEASATLASGKGINYYTKNQGVSRLGLDWKPKPQGSLSLGAGYDLTLRDYIDAYVFSADGTVDTKQRRFDTLHSLQARLTLGLNPHWVANAGLQSSLNNSNKNEFNMRLYGNTFSYHAEELSLGLLWLAQAKSDGHRVSLNSRAMNRSYDSKPIRSANGTYQAGAQADFETGLTLRGDYELPHGLSLWLQGRGEWVRSNQAFEPGVRYTYEWYSVGGGLGYRL